MHIKKYLTGAVLLLSLATVFIYASSASAATLSIIPASGTVRRGDQVTVYIRINSSNTSINAAQATINFPADKLQATSFDTKTSAFGFWLDGPNISNSDVTVKFIGGTTAVFSGAALWVLTINFNAIGSGSGVISASDAAITSNDGKGTNVLDGIQNGTIGVDVAISVTPQGQSAPEQPTVISRAPAPATGLPVAPKLRVPLYPDESKWYNQVGDAVVFWDVPADVTDVSARVVRAKTSDIGLAERELLNGKDLGVLDDGIWYARVQFQNSKGWGPAAYYGISIDTTSPLPFKLGVDNPESDNPAPEIFYETQDALSGIDRYEIRIDGADLFLSTSTSSVLPVQAPGEHIILVRAVDRAGNFAENAITLKILPIAQPTITFITKDTYLGEGPLQINGAVAAGTKPYIFMKGKNGDIILNADPVPDSNGNWSATFDLPRKSGAYYLEILAKDSRGAQSLPIKSEFNVRPRPLFVFWGLEITSGTLAVLLLLLLVGGFFAGYFTQKLAKEQRGRKVVIAQRDISVIFNLLRKDIDKMLDDYSDETINEAEAKEIEFYLKRMKENLDKMKRYMSENVEEIRD